MNSSFNALVPGAIAFGHRAVVRMEQVLVNDGGSDGVSGTHPNTRFAVQGIFAP